MFADEIAYMSALEIALRIRRRQFSPVEVVEAFIQRVEERNPSINALVYFGFDDARSNAKAAEQALVQGDELGPLHGVPVVIKDNFDHKPGWVSTLGGVRALKNFVADTHCIFAERIEKAGAIILGKTNSPSLGFRGTCDNYLFGPSRNPFKPVKNTGGSSGGSAAAVADGLVPLAEGTDGGGSIRIPSSWCGVYGYKASFGRVPMVSRPNAFGTTMPFVFEGPITRNVEDAAIALTSLAGYNSRDPFCLEETVDFVPATRQSIRGWKIAYSPNWDVFPVETPVRAVVDKALRAFLEAGAYVEEVKVGIKRPQKELSDVWCRMCMLGELEAIEDLKRHGFDILRDHLDDLPPLFHHWAEISGRMTATEYLHDQEIRTEVLDAVRTVLDNYRLLVTPTLACVAVDNSEDGDTKGPSRINDEEVDPLIGWCLTYPVNFTGNPAASIPAGLSDDNLPIGMQIIGRRYADADVLAASAAFERLRPWGHTYQICAQRPL